MVFGQLPGDPGRWGDQTEMGIGHSNKNVYGSVRIGRSFRRDMLSTIRQMNILLLSIRKIKPHLHDASYLTRYACDNRPEA